MIKSRPLLGRAFKILSKRQQAWARSCKFPFGADCSVAKLDQNLFRPLRPETLLEFAAADGKELDVKLKKLYSSSALVANVFDYLRDRPAIAAACFELPTTTSMSFERNRSIFNGLLPAGQGNSRRKNPNIDLEFAGENSSLQVAVECKFTEPFVKYPQTRLPFTSTYFCPDAEPIWADMERTRALAIRLRDESPLFTRLDAAQLIRTALACKRTSPECQWRLVYVWFDVVGDLDAAEECRSFSEELNNFREQTSGEIPLEVLTWQEVFLRLQALCDPADSTYVGYLQKRYFR